MINKPFYAKHQILTGQYSSGEQFITSNGDDYIGGYHVLPNGQLFTGFSPTDKSEELYEKRFDWTKDVALYNSIKQISTTKYVQPTPYLPRPTLEEYQEGYLYRYFVQKRNNPLVTIIEIDVDQYNKINSKNQPGLNSVIWNGCLLKWKINGSYVEEHNIRIILEAAIHFGFVGLNARLTNLHEYAK